MIIRIARILQTRFVLCSCPVFLIYFEREAEDFRTGHRSFSPLTILSRLELDGKTPDPHRR